MPPVLPDCRGGQACGGGRAARAWRRRARILERQRGAGRTRDGPRRAFPAASCPGAPDSPGSDGTPHRSCGAAGLHPSPRDGGVMTAHLDQVANPDLQLPNSSELLEVGSWELGVDKAPIAVECLEDSWGFTSLGPSWNELLRDSAADNPFLTWEWLQAWWV